MQKHYNGNCVDFSKISPFHEQRIMSLWHTSMTDIADIYLI